MKENVRETYHKKIMTRLLNDAYARAVGQLHIIMDDSIKDLEERLEGERGSSEWMVYSQTRFYKVRRRRNQPRQPGVYISTGTLLESRYDSFFFHCV